MRRVLGLLLMLGRDQEADVGVEKDALMVNGCYVDVG
jgi:hypothetical protein